MHNQEKLYIAQEDLYRLGNAGSSLISRVRVREVDVMEVNGIKKGYRQWERHQPI